MAALAQDNRLDVFRLLVQTGAGGLPAGGIAERLGIASPTLSFHLAQLRHAGLVETRRDGRSLIYAAKASIQTSFWVLRRGISLPQGPLS